MDYKKIVLDFFVNIIPVISAIYLISGVQLIGHRRRNAAYFALVMFAASIYSFGYYLELISPSLEVMRRFRDFEYLGTLFIPSFGLLFIMKYTETKISKAAGIGLPLVSAAMWALFLTDPLHHAFYRSIEYYRGAYSVPLTVKGPVFYAFLAYIGVFLIASDVLLIRAYRRSSGSSRRKSIRFVLVTMQLPWIAVIYIVTGMDVFFDIVPATIFVVCWLFMVNEIKNGMFMIRVDQWIRNYGSSDSPAVLTDTDRVLVAANGAAQELIAGGLSIPEIIRHCDSREPLPVTAEDRTLWFDLRRIEYGRHGNLTYFLFSDVTDKKEKSLIFESFFNTIEDFIIIAAEDGRILFVNREVRRRLGYSDEEYAGMHVADLYPPELREQVLEGMALAASGGTGDADLPIMTKDGRLIHVETHTWSGKWIGKSVVYGISKDVTMLKEAETKFMKSFLYNPSAMTLSDAHTHRFASVNDAFVRKTGYSAEESVGKTPWDLDLYVDEAQYGEAARLLRNFETFKDVEMAIRTRDGRILTGLFSCERIESGSSAQLLTVMLDVTENRRKDRLLQVVTAVTQEFLETHDLMEVIPDAFRSLGESLDVSRIGLFRGIHGGSAGDGTDAFLAGMDAGGAAGPAELRAEWCAPGVRDSRQICGFRSLSADEVRGMIGDVSDGSGRSAADGEPFAADTEDLEGSPAARLLQEQDVMSMLSLPILSGGVFWGFVRIDECRRERSWTEMEQNVLRLFASSLVKAVERQETEERLMRSEQKNRAILSAIPDMFFILSPEGVIMDYYASDESRLAMDPARIPGSNIVDIFPASASVPALSKICDAIATGENQVFEYDLDGGTEEFFEARVVPNSTDSALLIVRGISERKKLEIAQTQEKDLLETTLVSVGDGVISTDRDGRVIFMNRIAEALTGWTAAEAAGQPVGRVFALVSGTTGEKYPGNTHDALKKKKILKFDREAELVARDGTRCAVEGSAAPILRKDGDAGGAVLIFRDFSERKKGQEEIEFLSFHDPLTGLYNRRYYDNAVGMLNDDGYLPTALIMIDVNGVKIINDAFGHIAGDLLLKRISDVLKRECRDRDIITRIGGDEFVVLMPKTGPEEASRTVRRIIASLEKEKTGDNSILSVSAGYAVRQDPDEGFDAVFKKAEDIMYKHKLTESPDMKSRVVDMIMHSLYEDPKAKMHSKRVSSLCSDVAGKTGCSREEIFQTTLSGLMHDIGKIGLARRMPSGNAGAEDMDLELSGIERHPEIGYRILGSVSEYSDVAIHVLQHHERWDGSGYPMGLKEEAISLPARIIAASDYFDHLVSDRDFTEARAAEEISKLAGTRFDPSVASAILALKGPAAPEAGTGAKKSG